MNFTLIVRKQTGRNIISVLLIPHILRYQGLAVDDSGLTFGALDLQHLRLLQC